MSSSFLPVKICPSAIVVPQNGKTCVSSDKVDLGVTVLSSLGGGHVDDLARTSLDDNVTVLPESGTLHAGGELALATHHLYAQLEQLRRDSREGLGGTGSGGLESLVVLVVRHFCSCQLEAHIFPWIDLLTVDQV